MIGIMGWGIMMGIEVSGMVEDGRARGGMGWGWTDMGGWEGEGV